MRVLWLPTVLRKAGLTVHTYPGWQTRGSSRWGEEVGFGPLRGVVCHATAGSRGSSDAGEMRVLWETGSPSAPVPISQLYLSRTGEWTVGASGRCNHVLLGHKGPHRGFGNYQLLGVEAANDNRGEPWPPAQVDAYRRGVAAICRHMGWPAGVVVAHREHQDGKSDPSGLDMAGFRARVAELLAAVDDDEGTTGMSRQTVMLGVYDALHAAVHSTEGSDWDARTARQIRDNLAALVRPAVAAEVATARDVLLAAVAGRDVADTVRQLLDEAAAREQQQRLAELGEVTAALEQAARERAELVELVQLAGSGELAAAEVVAEMGRRLLTAGAPADDEQPPVAG